MSVFKKRGTALAAGVLAFLALVIVGISVGNDYWVEAELIRNVQIANSNDSVTNVNGGTKYFGLFHGCETKIWALVYISPRERCFDVNDELPDLIDLGYFSATLGLLCVSVFFLLVAAVLGIWNEFTTPFQWIFNPPGIYISNALACVFLLISMAVFGGVYDSTLKGNVLPNSDRVHGFVTKEPTQLSYCYWILMAAVLITIINILLTFINKARVRHEFHTANKLPSANNVDGMMLY